MYDLLVVGAAEDSLGEALVDKAIARRGWSVVGTHHDWFNVFDPDGMRTYIERYGPFNHVAYCAGIESLTPVRSMDEEVLRRTFGINAFGFALLMQILVDTQGGGDVLAITSDAAKMPMRNSLAYCSSKAALEMMVRCCARELAPNWRVNGLAPGTIEDTGMTRRNDAVIPETRGWTPEEAYQYEVSRIPMGRRASRAEIVPWALDILSGPWYMTGEIITVNGGR